MQDKYLVAARTSSPQKAQKALTKGQTTRNALLAAATQVFSEFGYINAEISQITKKAGKSVGVFYTYFSNKADVLGCLVAAFNQDMADQLVSPTNAPEDVRRVLAAIWANYKIHAPTLLALNEAATVDPVFAEALDKVRDFAREDFAGMIRARRAQGLCQGLDDHFAGMALETMVMYCLNEWLGRGGGLIRDAAEERRAFDTLAGVLEAVLKA
jgi:AcrR family transcriptional regulator